MNNSHYLGENRRIAQRRYGERRAEPNARWQARERRHGDRRKQPYAYYKELS